MTAPVPVFHAWGEPGHPSWGPLTSQALPAPQLLAFLWLGTLGQGWRSSYLFLTGEAARRHTALPGSMERAAGEPRSVAGSGVPVARRGLGRRRRLAGCCRTQLILLSFFFEVGFFLKNFFFYKELSV